MFPTLLKIRETNIHLRMDIPSSSLTVRISSWKWAFQPCKISIWIWSHLSFVDQIHIRRSKNDLFQRDILTAKDVCFIVTRTDIYLTYDDGGRPFSNGNPSWLECSFSGRYPYCEGGWRNIHPRLVVRLSFFFTILCSKWISIMVGMVICRTISLLWWRIKEYPSYTIPTSDRWIFRLGYELRISTDINQLKTGFIMWANF